MCGIAGWLNVEMSREAATRSLAAMCGVIEHRGPDDRGLFVGERIALGMQRLSIIDLAGGNQPMASDDGALQLVFNGEIYNHQTLRAQLVARGATFRTRSDTEVVLRTYECHGVDGFAAFNGMFAFALWDARNGKLHLVRDRLGVKPLYYALQDGVLIFASEIKAILASELVPRVVNPRAIWDFLTLRYVPAPETIWRGIFKLPAGHRLAMRADDTIPTIERWWDVPFYEQKHSAAGDTIVEEFADLFEDAVDLRMLADVPVGILLSGGLDSSAVAAAACRHGGTVKSFSVAFEGAVDIDERGYARMVARHLGTEHHEVTIGRREFIDFLPQLVHLTDEPLADLASVPLFYVNKLARNSVKVVLSGEGSDEILGGYSFDRWVERWDKARSAASGLAGMVTGSVFGGALARLSPTVAARRRLAMTETDLRNLAVPPSMTDLATSAEKRQWLLAPIDCADSLDSVRHALRRIGRQQPLDQMLYVYIQDWLVEDLLMKADRMSMANSIELRTPFLDYRLVEWVWRLPSEWKVGRGADGRYVTKRVLREYAKPRLPAAVVSRPKLGFPVPVYDWLSDGLGGWARDLLGGRARLRAWLNDAALDRMLAAGTAAQADTAARHRLWNLIVLELWLQRWQA